MQILMSLVPKPDDTGILGNPCFLPSLSTPGAPSFNPINSLDDDDDDDDTFCSRQNTLGFNPYPKSFQCHTPPTSQPTYRLLTPKMEIYIQMHTGAQELTQPLKFGTL